MHRPSPPQGGTVVLRGAHVFDSAMGIDRVADVTLANGVVAAVGSGPHPTGAEVLDLRGHFLSPGWIDLHVHAYGTLGFADPDSIGIAQGVTTFVEAGGPGIGTLDEFLATMADRTDTELYAGLYLRPLGIIGLTFVEEEVRSLADVPLARWLDALAAHRDLIRYVKMGAFAKCGPGPLRIGKGLAEILGLPLYVHTGEFAWHAYARGSHDVYRLTEAGDIITHLYNGNLGNILDDDGRVLAVVRDAQRRGVLFDIGFGGYNFSWEVAEKGFAQEVVPHLISSDLQQFNVNGPVFSLANVLAVFLRLGMSLREVIERVTAAPARALKLDDRAGSLQPGMPADVTIFRVDAEEFALADARGQTRTATQRIVPIAAYKDGVRYDSDLQRCSDERNWLMQIAEDAPPAASARLTAPQRAFAAALAERIEPLRWTMSSPKEQDLEAATALQAALHAARGEVGLDLRDALGTLYDCFVEHRFAVQSGLFLLRLDRAFALERLRQVAALRPAHAS